MTNAKTYSQSRPGTSLGPSAKRKPLVTNLGVRIVVQDQELKLADSLFIRHIKCVRLINARHKVNAYQKNLGLNTRNLIYRTGSESTKALFNINSNINTSSSVFRSKSIKVFVRPHHRQT